MHDFELEARMWSKGCVMPTSPSRTFENLTQAGKIEDERESNEIMVPGGLAVSSKMSSGLRVRINDCG